MTVALLEICCYSVDDAHRAAQAGADRIELCREPAADGLTPRTADLRAGAKLLRQVPVHPIVRPRASFTADAADAAAMVDSLALVRELGYPGAVLGVLDASGSAPDWPLLDRLVVAAEGLSLTFHRAFDLIADQPSALTGLADLGFARVLTSGRPGRACDHLDELAALARLGADRGITVMAGGGVTAADVPALLAAGMREVHASAGGSQGAMSVDEVHALAAAAAAATGPTRFGHESRTTLKS